VLFCFRFAWREATRCTGDTLFPTLCPTISFTLLRKAVSATYTSYYQKLTTSIEQNVLKAVNRHQDTQRPPPPPPPTITWYPKRRHLIRKSSLLAPTVRQLNYNNDVSSYFFRTNLVLSSKVIMPPRGLHHSSFPANFIRISNVPLALFSSTSCICFAKFVSYRSATYVRPTTNTKYGSVPKWN